MPCFYCGKRVSLVRQLTDADFCSDEHRQRYNDLARSALGLLAEAEGAGSAAAAQKHGHKKKTAAFTHAEAEAAALPAQATGRAGKERQSGPPRLAAPPPPVPAIEETPGFVEEPRSVGRYRILVPPDAAPRRAAGVRPSARVSADAEPVPSEAPLLPFGPHGDEGPAGQPRTAAAPDFNVQCWVREVPFAPAAAAPVGAVGPMPEGPLGVAAPAAPAVTAVEFRRSMLAVRHILQPFDDTGIAEDSERIAAAPAAGLLKVGQPDPVREPSPEVRPGRRRAAHSPGAPPSPPDAAGRASVESTAMPTPRFIVHLPSTGLKRVGGALPTEDIPPAAPQAPAKIQARPAVATSRSARARRAPLPEPGPVAIIPPLRDIRPAARVEGAVGFGEVRRPAGPATRATAGVSAPQLMPFSPCAARIESAPVSRQAPEPEPMRPAIPLCTDVQEPRLTVWRRHARMACDPARTASGHGLAPIPGAAGPLAWEARTRMPEAVALPLGGSAGQRPLIRGVDLVEPMRIPPAKAGAVRTPAAAAVAMPAQPVVMVGRPTEASVGTVFDSADAVRLAPPKGSASVGARREEGFLMVARAMRLPERTPATRGVRLGLDPTVASGASPAWHDNARGRRLEAVAPGAPAPAGIGATGFGGPAARVLFTPGLAHYTTPAAVNPRMRASSADAREFTATAPVYHAPASPPASRGLPIRPAMQVQAGAAPAPRRPVSTAVPLAAPRAAIAGVAAPPLVTVLASASAAPAGLNAPHGGRTLREGDAPGFDGAFQQPRAASMRSAAPGTVWPPDAASRPLPAVPPGMRPGRAATPAGAAGTAFEPPAARLLRDELAGCALAELAMFPLQQPGFKMRAGLDRPVQAIPPEHRTSGCPSRLPVCGFQRRKAAMPDGDLFVPAAADEGRDHEDWRTVRKATACEATPPGPHIPAASAGLPAVGVVAAFPPLAAPPPSPPFKRAPRDGAGPSDFSRAVWLPGLGFAAPVADDSSIYAQSKNWELKDAWKSASRLFR